MDYSEVLYRMLNSGLGGAVLGGFLGLLIGLYHAIKYLFRKLHARKKQRGVDLKTVNKWAAEK